MCVCVCPETYSESDNVEVLRRRDTVANAVASVGLRVERRGEGLHQSRGIKVASIAGQFGQNWEHRANHGHLFVMSGSQLVCHSLTCHIRYISRLHRKQIVVN